MKNAIAEMNFFNELFKWIDRMNDQVGRQKKAAQLKATLAENLFFFVCF